MGIDINKKHYEFNSDVRLGILEMMEDMSKAKLKHIKIILKEILIPTPTPKELFNFRRSHSEKIFKLYGEFIDKETAEIKKKLST